MSTSSIIKLAAPSGSVLARVQLPGSKSESNRALILSALSGGKIKVTRLSEAHDTVLMQKLLSLSAEGKNKFNAEDAGTVFRFLTAFLAFRNEKATITGTPRMCERPVWPLVDALRAIGADIRYMEKPGFPPLQIEPVVGGLQGNNVSIPGDISSQFVSALLLIAPFLPDGLEICLTGEIGSRPYIELTLAQMKSAGILHGWEGHTIKILPQKPKPTVLTISPDWSAASYWLSIATLSPHSEIFLYGLTKNSLQGDRVVATWMEKLGLELIWEKDGLKVKNREVAFGDCSLDLSQPLDLGGKLEWDFSNHPDLAQTLIPLAAALGIKPVIRGLESLRIKETDRVAALQKELAQFGVNLIEENKVFRLEGKFKKYHHAVISTYGDHRMAMGFAPLVLVCEAIWIRNPEVVRKSYPGFWLDLLAAGFRVEQVD